MFAFSLICRLFCSILYIFVDLAILVTMSEWMTTLVRWNKDDANVKGLLRVSSLFLVFEGQNDQDFDRY